MSTNTLATSILLNQSWRNAIDYLVDLLACTRFQAASIIARAMDEGYLR